MYADVDAFNDEIKDSGAWVFAGGLHPRRHRDRRQAPTAASVTTDGPFAESKEQLGGFWVIEAADLDAALALGREGARRLPGARSRSGPSRTSREA